MIAPCKTVSARLRMPFRYLLLTGALIAGRPHARAQSLTTFRVANGTSGENPAVLWVGVDQGIYRKHGLNVEVIFMRTGPLAMSALVSGDVSAVLTSSNNVLNVAARGLW